MDIVNFGAPEIALLVSGVVIIAIVFYVARQVLKGLLLSKQK